MAGYLGIHAQISRNNRLTVIYLLAFPLLILGTVYALLFFVVEDDDGNPLSIQQLNESFVLVVPYLLAIVAIWFIIAYISHSRLIDSATGAKPLERKENMRVYNLAENLCMLQGMPMPKIHIIEDTALNAFASGLSEKNYTVTLSRGIIDNLNDDELQAVIAHELMHIRNRDVRLLVITIVFVGIFSFAAQMMFRSMLLGSGGGGKKGSRNGIIVMFILTLAFLLAILFKLGLSRKREFAADAGAADITKNPNALASALRKISANHQIKTVKSADIKEMFIYDQPDSSLGIMKALAGLFSTHPPIEKRISVLEQF